MIFGQDRSELRKMYADAWQKRCDQRPLSPQSWHFVVFFEYDRVIHAVLKR